MAVPKVIIFLIIFLSRWLTDVIGAASLEEGDEAKQQSVQNSACHQQRASI